MKRNESVDHEHLILFSGQAIIIVGYTLTKISVRFQNIMNDYKICINNVLKLFECIQNKLHAHKFLAQADKLHRITLYYKEGCN